MRSSFLLSMIMVMMFAACGGGELLSKEGCRSDADCKNGRVCVDGTCRYPEGGCTSDSQCPPGSRCMSGTCTVCDGDLDGVENPACGGDDCNDTNSSVYPGAKELCGDKLDNDCDGKVDPDELCSACAAVECPPGYACDPSSGNCILVCNPDCQGRECGPDGCGGSCGECDAPAVCNQLGKCTVGCVDACEQEGASVCVEGGVATCRDSDGDGCLEWDGPEPCPEGTSCMGGECRGCEPDCGGRECGPDGCGGSCGECPQGMFCSIEGLCVGCRDECQPGTYCISERSYAMCDDFDGDGCYELGEEQFCPADEWCDPTLGLCTGGGCTDECQPGQARCTSEFSYILCGNYDQDPCLEFGTEFKCPEDQPCDEATGRCTGSCTDECNGDEFVCTSPRRFSVCGDFDGDGCLEMSSPQPCPQGTRCNESARSCVAGCRDECQYGQSMCLDDWHYFECGQYDNDPCTEWGPPQPCADGERCDYQSGRCMPTGECVPDSFEDDDDMDTATYLEFFTDQLHSICPAGDRDFWLAELPEPGVVVFETDGPAGDTMMRLFGDDGQEIAYDDDSGPDLFSRIELTLAPGRYFLVVYEYGGAGIIPEYYLTSSYEPCMPDCSGRECGPDPVCGFICGTCPSQETCTPEGRCEPTGGHPGAGAYCDQNTPCDYGTAGANICIEHPGQLQGFCSYNCAGDDECSRDFFGGCCRELAPGYAVCLPIDYCNIDLPGYLEPCSQLCMPDMICVPDYASNNVCVFTCDLPAGWCPAGGTCADVDLGSSTGVCIPSGNNQFGEPCTLADACASGLLCLSLDEQHPGYCNRLCSSLFPCPAPFQCVLSDGQGGQYCAVLCNGDSDCAQLGDWFCKFYDSGAGACVPR